MVTEKGEELRKPNEMDFEEMRVLCFEIVRPIEKSLLNFFNSNKVEANLKTEKSRNR